MICLCGKTQIHAMKNTKINRQINGQIHKTDRQKEMTEPYNSINSMGNV